MAQHHAQHHTAAQRTHDGQSAKDGDCCAQCADSCKTGDGSCKAGDCKSGGDGAQSCKTCKMGAQHKHAASHHAVADDHKSDCCAGCACCATKDAAR
jgi:hypothetical protein